MIRGQPEGRFDRVISEQMFDLELDCLVEATAETESIHIWRPPKASSKGKDKTIMSVETDDVDHCVREAENGASLYFTSSPEFRESYGKALSY